MIKRASSGRILSVPLDARTSTPLHRQVYDGLRTLILDGTLRRGAPVSSTRELAHELGVSRSTVILAYKQLRDEGYLLGRMGSVTRVCATLPDLALHAAPAPAREKADAHRATPSARAARMHTIPRRPDLTDHAPRAFRAAVPAVDMLPVDSWGRLLARRWRRASARALAYGDPFGYRPLREAIAEYLATARGVVCSADRVMIVNGALEAFDLACRVILDPGDVAWLEDPGYFAAHGPLTSAGARIARVRVDAHGLDVAHGRQIAPRARLAFVTPGRQFPLGVSLSLERRLALIEWARSAGAWIFEDDYDGEFRYSGRPLAALQGLDPDGSVIYAGTFSKVLFPALRIGYVVLPSALVDAFGAARYFLDFSSSYLEQAVLTDFITEGHFERHIRRTRAVYAERQALLFALARKHLAGRLTLQDADAGMTVVGWLPPGTRESEIARAASERGVDVDPLGAFAHRTMPPGLLLGYAGIRDVEIREGMGKLVRAFDDLDHARGSGRRVPRRATVQL